MIVLDPMSICEKEFDFVYIAVENEKTALEMKNDLLSIGVDGNRIIWKPLCRYF